MKKLTDNVFSIESSQFIGYEIKKKKDDVLSNFLISKFRRILIRKLGEFFLIGEEHLLFTRRKTTSTNPFL